jgi:rhodanese-related sulfurtransferase
MSHCAWSSSWDVFKMFLIYCLHGWSSQEATGFLKEAALGDLGVWLGRARRVQLTAKANVY